MSVLPSALMAGEFLGICLILGLIGKTDNMYLLYLVLIFGMGMGYLFFLFVKQALENIPESEEY
jgi:hypothetical protein